MDDLSELDRRLRAIPAPKPILDPERERQLTERQKALLDQLSEIFEGGFAHLTMADLANQLNCSLRTLYALALSREELVLLVVDRNLWRAGRSAQSSIPRGGTALEMIRGYLEAATIAVSRTTEAFARDLAGSPGTLELRRGHNDYIFAVTKTLLDYAVEEGSIADVDTVVVAYVMAGLAREFGQPDVIKVLRTSPKQAADTVLELLLLGLQCANEDR